MKLARRATELSGSEWAYLVVAVVELLIARIRLTRLDSPQIVHLYAKAAQASPQSAGQPALPISLERMSWALGAVGARVPWRADCLVQAMAGHRWLRRHGIEAEFIIGVDKTEDGTFHSHAWLRHRGVVITGGPVDRFTPIVEPQPDGIR